MKSRGKWLKEDVLADARRFESRTKWTRGSYGAYQAALAHGWSAEACAHMRRLKVFSWSEAEILKSALKYSHRTKWFNAESGKYTAAIRMGILEKACAHMEVLFKRKWTESEAVEESKKYRTPSEWQRGSPGSYGFASRMGFLNQITSKMEKAERGRVIWTKDLVLSEARKYSRRSDWFRNSWGSYDRAIKTGILTECTAHMKRFGGTSRPEEALAEEIKALYPKTCENKKFRIKPHLECGAQAFELDIYIPSIKKGIEFNGTYWHGAGFKRTWTNDPAEYHKVKKEYFKSIDIEYIEIEESDWELSPENCLRRCLEFLAPTPKVSA